MGYGPRIQKCKISELKGLKTLSRPTPSFVDGENSDQVAKGMYLNAISLKILLIYFILGRFVITCDNFYSELLNRQRGSWEWGNGMRGTGIQIILGYLRKLNLTTTFNFFSEQFLPLYPYRSQHAID